MAFQSLGVPQEVAALMLSTIQDMCFFLRTGFGDSTAYAGLSGGKKTQGMCQGNKAVPAGMDSHKCSNDPGAQMERPWNTPQMPYFRNGAAPD